MKRLAIAAGLVTVFGLRSAFAGSAIEEVHIEYTAPPACPNETWVLERIRARTDRFRQVDAVRAARTFSISIAEAGAAFSGTLEISEREAATHGSSRRIVGKTCEEAADGLALIAALAIDPRAKVEALDEKPARAAPPVERPPAPPPPKPVGKAPPSDRPLPYLSLGAGIVGVSGAAPAFLYGGEGFVEVGFSSPQRWLSPGFRVTYRDTRREGVTFDQGTAYFRLSAIATDLCPVRVPIPTIGIRLCATGEFGWLEAQGTVAGNSQDSVRGWAALGSVLRLSAWTGRIGLEASFGAEAPLRRDRFFFDSEIGEVKLVVFYGGLAITGRIF